MVTGPFMVEVPAFAVVRVVISAAVGVLKSDMLVLEERVPFLLKH